MWLWTIPLGFPVVPEEYIIKNNNFVDENSEDFDFNQDLEFGEESRSPGWIRYQKKIKW